MTTPSHGVRMEYDYTTDIAGSNYTFPNAWLKLVRSGNTITTYDSPDGSTWTQVGSTSAVTLPATALVGVYVSSVNASTLSTATFDNVSVTRSSSASTVYRYGFSGSNSSPTVLTDSAGTVIETYTPLPGGILLTTRPNAAGSAQQTFSLPNIHGDVMATTDGTGTILGTYQYDPFGNPIGIASPGNATGSASYGWAGEHGKLTEIQFTLVSMQMGARVYFPILGRFASKDPIQGGNANPYGCPADLYALWGWFCAAMFYSAPRPVRTIHIVWAIMTRSPQKLQFCT